MSFVSQEHFEKHSDDGDAQTDTDDRDNATLPAILRCDEYNEIVKDRDDLKDKLEAQMQQLRTMKIEYVGRCKDSHWTMMQCYSSWVRE